MPVFFVELFFFGVDLEDFAVENGGDVLEFVEGSFHG